VISKIFICMFIKFLFISECTENGPSAILRCIVSQNFADVSEVFTGSNMWDFVLDVLSNLKTSLEF
jgi:hypothetical protein